VPRHNPWHNAALEHQQPLADGSWVASIELFHIASDTLWSYFQVAGAAAAAGLPLAEVRAEAEAAATAVGSMGVASRARTLPGAQPSDRWATAFPSFLLDVVVASILSSPAGCDTPGLKQRCGSLCRHDVTSRHPSWQRLAPPRSCVFAPWLCVLPIRPHCKEEARMSLLPFQTVSSWRTESSSTWMRRIADGKMELGLGIHGELGAETAPLLEGRSSVILHHVIPSSALHSWCSLWTTSSAGLALRLLRSGVQRCSISAALAIALAIPCTNWEALLPKVLDGVLSNARV